MNRLRDQLVDGDPHLFDQVEGSIAIQESSGIQEWRGRFWLPASSPVQPGGRFCLIPDEEQPVETQSWRIPDRVPSGRRSLASGKA
jgi:hypothetical protein